MSTWIFDVEVYPNCTLFCSQCVETDERQSFWHSESGSATRLRMFVADKRKRSLDLTAIIMTVLLSQLGAKVLTRKPLNTLVTQ